MILAGLLYADQHGHLSRLRRIFNWTLTPIPALASLPSRGYDALKTNLTFRSHLIQENENLKKSLLLLSAQVQELESIANDNKALRGLLQSSSRVSGQVLMAQLVAVDLAPYTHQVTVNQGDHAAVYIGQPVLGAKGVLGQVIETTKNTARVLLISDPKSAIPVIDTRSHIRAIAVGTGDIEQLQLINVPQTSDLKVGDRLVTSGLGDVYPAGYPVGKIVKRLEIPGETFASIRVFPTAALNHGRHVLLAWPPNRGLHHA